MTNPTVRNKDGLLIAHISNAAFNQILQIHTQGKWEPYTFKTGEKGSRFIIACTCHVEYNFAGVVIYFHEGYAIYPNGA